MKTIFLLPASVVARLAPSLAQTEKNDAVPSALAISAKSPGYWRRMALVVFHAAAQSWGHVRFHS